jgi:hypothetical protein
MPTAPALLLLLFPAKQHKNTFSNDQTRAIQAHDGVRTSSFGGSHQNIQRTEYFLAAVIRANSCWRGCGPIRCALHHLFAGIDSETQAESGVGTIGDIASDGADALHIRIAPFHSGCGIH